MKLPNADKAVVSREKVADYLLNAAHPDNGGKAGFFIQLGFRRDQWETLAAALKAVALEAERVTAADSPHEKKYLMVGRMQSPTGKTPLVQTIWIVDKGKETAKLVTAYPHQA